MKNKSREEIVHLISNDFAHSPNENTDQMYDTVKNIIQNTSWNFIDEDQFVSVVKNHKRGTKYWLCERYVILKKYLIDHNSKREISNKLMIPYSTVSNLLNNCGVGMLNEVIRVLPIKWLHRYIDPITQFIEIFISNSESGFDAKELQMRIEQETKLAIDYSFIRNLLRRKFRLSYKKGSPRPLNIDLVKQRYVRILFWKELINTMDSNSIFINIDEVSISYKTKYNYSWLPWGKSAEIKNMHYKGSKSIIMAISSTGHWFVLPLVLKNNTKTFLRFLNKLLIWIEWDLGWRLSEWIITMDNSKVHKTNKVLDLLDKCGAKIAFIPAYTPSLAPIELIFNVFKRSLNKQWKDRTVILNKLEGLRQIKETLALIDKTMIIKVFRKFIKALSEMLL